MRYSPESPLGLPMRFVRPAVLGLCALFALGSCRSLAKKRGTAKLSSPNEGPASTAKTLETPGRVLVDYLGRGEYRGAAASRTPAPPTMASRSVVPLVDVAWKPGEPIPMWVSGAAQRGPKSSWVATLPTREAAERAWAKALSSALAKGPISGKVTDRAGRDTSGSRGPSAETKAMADAEAKHGLTSVPNAPVISWKP